MTIKSSIIKVITSLFILIFLFTSSVAANGNEFIPSGEIIYFTFKTKYPYIQYKIDSSDQDKTLQGEDIVLSVKLKNKKSVSNLKDIEDILKIENKGIEIKYLRDGKEHLIETTTDILRKYKISDNLQGAATLTTIDKNGNFTAMSHNAKLNDSIVEIKNGNIYKASYVQEKKSEKGNVGHIDTSSKGEVIGVVDEVNDSGVKGKIAEKYYKNRNYSKIAKPKAGKAYLYSTAPITNEIKKYEIEVIEVDKNLAKIRVMDDELIKHRGGLVDGMSGSPVVQDGDIIGGLRFIIVDNPSEGYIINIEDIIKE